MSKPPKIDITKKVMSQIESGQIKMRPKSYFVAKKVVKFAGLAVIAIALLAAIFYAVVIIQNGVFKEYLEFGKQGASIFWSSLPWGAIVISILLTVAMGLGIYLVQQKKRLLPSMIGVVAAVALVTALVFKISPDPTTNALAKAVVNSDGNPTKISCTVEEKNGNKLKVKTSTGEIVVIEIDNETFGDKSLNPGDELLVLGTKQNGTVNADAIKTTKKAESKVTEVKQEQPATTPPEVKPEEPKLGQKPTATAPAVTKPTSPSGSTPPPAPTEYINLSSSVTGLPAGGPFTKFYVTWSANFSAYYKLVWSTSAYPTWPTSHYSYSGVFGSSDSGKVLKDMGSGTYYVRACRYTPGSSTCDLYSNQITVVFP